MLLRLMVIAKSALGAIMAGRRECCEIADRALSSKEMLIDTVIHTCLERCLVKGKIIRNLVR
jgi:hypothetical protein